jgi:hypothetical protein
MLSEARAERLARRAAARDGHGGRTLLSRRAWRVLTKRGDRGDPRAADAVWQAWLREPGDELWQALARWRGPRAVAEAAFTAGTDVTRDAAARAAIGGFCARHRLAPGDPVRRALFHVLTGLSAQHRAADPDGSLLAAAYRAAGEPERAAVRQAVAGSGDLDVVLVVAGAGQDGRAGDLTPDERQYLARQLADRREWDRLWRLAQELPLAGALEVAPLFDARWRPGPERERAVFGRMNHAGPRALAAARDALAAAVVRRADLDGTPVAGSFSPDGQRLAVATKAAIFVLDLPGFSLAGRYPLGHFWPTCLLDLGDAILACGWDGPMHRDDRPAALTRYAADGTRAMRPRARRVRVAPHPAGFIVLDTAFGERRHRRGHGRVQVCAASGRVISDVSVADLGIPGGPGPWMVAADPASGRIALGGHGVWILDEDARRVIAGCPWPGRITEGYWAGDSQLAVKTVQGKPIPSRWIYEFHLAGSRLVSAFARGIVGPLQYAGGYRHVAELIAIPDRGEIALLRPPGGEVGYYAGNLADVAEPRELTGRSGTALWASPDGRYHALAGEGRVDVVSRSLFAVDQLADRPMGGLRAADLATVNAAARDTAPGSPLRPWLELLQAFLYCRFGTDVRIGRAAPPAGDATDIAGRAGREPVC